MNEFPVMDLPTMSKTSYANNTTTTTTAAGHGLIMGNAVLGGGLAGTDTDWMRAANLSQAAAQQNTKPRRISPLMKEQSMNRIVKVFIADIDNNIPTDKRVIYRGEEKFTDLTDQELYFELPMASMLEAHNAYRATLMDKKSSEKFGRDVKLEPIKVRDLKMCVVDIASF